MGDATSSLKPDDSNCKPRPDGAQGRCHVFRVDTFGSEGWAGLYWLANEDDWGQTQGVAIESGAREVSFLAATYSAQTIEFFVGGVDQSGAPYRDSFEERISVELTNDWTRVTIPLEGASYDRVIGGFGWTTKTAPTVLYVDDIRWD